MQPQYQEWYRKHLYVLFTRPTNRLVVNYDNEEDFENTKKVVNNLQKKGAKVSIRLLST